MALSEIAMGQEAKPTHARASRLPLESITIEWQPAPSEDVIARLLLDLLGDDAIEEIFNEKGS